MVRKSLRSYAAIERAFQALDHKEQEVRRKFEPVTEQEREAWSLGAANWLTPTKHRYADVLEWKDDASTLRTVDLPAGERKDRALRLRSSCPSRPRHTKPLTATKPLILQKGSRDQDVKRAAQTPTTPRGLHGVTSTATSIADTLRGNAQARENSPSRQISPRAAPSAASRPHSAHSSRQNSPDKHRDTATQRPVSARVTADVGANATALTAAVRQAAAYVSHRPASAATPDADAPSALLLRRHASAHCLSVVTISSMGQQIVPPISKRAKARAELHAEEEETGPTDMPATSNHQPTAQDAAYRRLGINEHHTLVRFQTHEAGGVMVGAGSALLPPMPRTHPHQHAGAAVLPPQAENELILSAMQRKSNGQTPSSDPASPVVLTPQARLMYLGHAKQRPEAEAGTKLGGRRTRSASPRRRPSGGSRPVSAGSHIPHAADHSPTRTRPISASPQDGHTHSPSMGGVHGASEHAHGGTCASACKPPVSHRGVGKPPLARPQSARPASATHATYPPTQSQTSDIHTVSLPESTLGTVAHRVDTGAEKSDVDSGLVSGVRPRPWSSSACVTGGLDQHGDGGWGQLEATCPAEQYVLPRRHPQAHLVGVTVKGQRLMRRAARWAASAPLRPTSAPSLRHVQARVDSGPHCKPQHSNTADATVQKTTAHLRGSQGSVHTGTAPHINASAPRTRSAGSSLVLTSPEAAYAQFASEQARRELGIIEDNEDLEYNASPNPNTHTRPHSHTLTNPHAPLANVRYASSPPLSTRSSFDAASQAGGALRESALFNANWSVADGGGSHSLAVTWGVGRSGSSDGGGAERSPQSHRAGAMRAARDATWQRVAGAAGLTAAETAALAASSRPATPNSPGLGTLGRLSTPLNPTSALRASKASVCVSDATARQRGGSSVAHSGGDGLVGAIAREVAARNPYSKKEEGLGSVQLLADVRRYGPSAASAPRNPSTHHVAAWLETELPTTPHADQPTPTTPMTPPTNLSRGWGKRGSFDGGCPAPLPPSPAALPPTPSSRGTAERLRWKDEEHVSSKALCGDSPGSAGPVRKGPSRGSSNDALSLAREPSADDRNPGSATSSMRNRDTDVSNDPQLYQLTAQVQTNGLKPPPDNLAGWLFNLYVTDLGRSGSKRGVRYCVARHTVCDSRQRVLVPCHGDSQPYEEPRGEYKAHITGPCTATLSLSHLLPWVRRPQDLYLHWVRVEAYVLVPVAVKVLDACVFLCGPEDDVPGAAPDVTKMSIKELADSGKKEWQR